jgi:hypothetical protein
MKHAPRVVAEHPSGAARHGGQCYLPPMRPSRAPPVADDPEHGGGRGLGGTPSLGRLPRASPSVWGRLRACTDLVGRAPRPAWRPFLGLPWECLRIFGEVPHQRDFKAVRIRLYRKAVFVYRYTPRCCTEMRSIGDDRGEATFSFSAHALSCVNICIV